MTVMLDSFYPKKAILNSLISYNSFIFLSHPNPQSYSFFFKHTIAIFSLFHGMQTPHNYSFCKTLNPLCGKMKFSEIQIKMKEKKKKNQLYVHIFCYYYNCISHNITL